MQEQSKIKIILYKIRNFFLIIIMIIINFFKSLFGSSKTTIQKQTIKKEQPIKQETKKEIHVTNTETTLPDEDNIKTNPHDNITTTEDTTNNTDIILEIPKEKLYKVYTKDNELKYLTLSALLDLIIKEELERIYKVEKFKLKTATTSELIKVEKIKERVLPEIITRVENETLRNSDVIREEVVIKLEEDLIKNPLFPPREPKIENKEIYTIAHPKKKEIKLNELELPKIKKETPKQVSEEQKEQIKDKIETTPIQVVPLVEEIPKPTLKDNIKEVAVAATVTTAGIINELTTKEETKEKETTPQEEVIEIKQDIDELKEELQETPKEKEEELIEELQNIEKKDKKELEELKKQVEEKIEQVKQEQQKKEEIKKDEEHELQVQEKEITAVTDVSENIIEDSKEEIKKEDFFDKDYERIERQIDKMLEDLTNTYLRYENKLTDKQKKKLKAEESKLRETKQLIKQQKSHDILVEQRELDATIHETEISGLKQELDKIHKENEQEVSNNLLQRMERFEGMTAEQVKNADKRVLLKRFNKANLILEMTSLLALPFVRNKYFFYFTAGLIVDNHFNFVNAFFNRKYSKYDPADLEQIKQGQDALNGALDVTYKNLVELEYLEQRALGRYPELATDPRFINQVTRLKSNLNNKYNKLMRKNKVMEKYRMKTKKHIKILKPKHQQEEQEAA